MNEESKVLKKVFMREHWMNFVNGCHKDITSSDPPNIQGVSRNMTVGQFFKMSSSIIF